MTPRPIDADFLSRCIGTMESASDELQRRGADDAIYDTSGRNTQLTAWVHNQLVRMTTCMGRKDGRPGFHRGADVEQLRPQRPART